MVFTFLCACLGLNLLFSSCTSDTLVCMLPSIHMLQGPSLGTHLWIPLPERTSQLKCSLYLLCVAVRGQLGRVSSLFHYVGFRDQPQVVRLSGRHLYPLKGNFNSLWIIPRKKSWLVWKISGKRAFLSVRELCKFAPDLWELQTPHEFSFRAASPVLLTPLCYPVIVRSAIASSSSLNTTLLSVYLAQQPFRCTFRYILPSVFLLFQFETN